VVPSELHRGVGLTNRFWVARPRRSKLRLVENAEQAPALQGPPAAVTHLGCRIDRLPDRFRIPIVLAATLEGLPVANDQNKR